MSRTTPKRASNPRRALRRTESYQRAETRADQNRIGNDIRAKRNGKLRTVGALTPWERAQSLRRDSRKELQMQSRLPSGNIILRSQVVEAHGRTHVVDIVKPGNGTLTCRSRAIHRGEILLTGQRAR